MIPAAIAACLVLAAFFAGMETGLVAANQMNIYAKRERGLLGARCAHFLLHKPDRLLATTLIGTNAAVVSATVLLILFLRGLGIGPFVEWIGVFGLTLVILVFAEILPKSFFRTYADSFTLRCAPVLIVFYALFLPVAVLLNSIVRTLLFLAGRHKHVRKLPRSREDLRLLLGLRSREMSLPLEDQKLIDDLFGFSDTKAREVMVPFNRIPLCPAGSGPAEVVGLAEKSGARFLPVYAQRTDNIVGYFDVEDLLCRREAPLAQLVREAVFYPETKRIAGLLLEMNQKNQDLVFLCDEYGLISGLITRGEIVAEIVGSLPGEGPDAGVEVRKVAPGRYIAAGRTGLDDFTERTGIEVEKGAYDTIGGFLCDKLGVIPKVGAVYAGPDAVYKVLERDKKQVKKIEVRKTRNRE